MIRFFKSLYAFLLLTKGGFYFSTNLHKQKNGVWGFVRLNWNRGKANQYAIFDVDLDTGEKEYYHFHVGQTRNIFRIEFQIKYEIIKRWNSFSDC